jgi:hypothetical protein
MHQAPPLVWQCVYAAELPGKSWKTKYHRLASSYPEAMMSSRTISIGVDPPITPASIFSGTTSARA